MAKGSKATCPCCGQPVSREAEDAANEVIEKRVDEALATQQAKLVEGSQGRQSAIAELWQQVRKFGAPAKRSAKPGERFQIGVRLTAELKGRLDEAAEESGRSQSQEVEFRLERSFDRQSLIGEVLTMNFSSKQFAGLLWLLGLVMEDAARLAHNYVLERAFEGPDASPDAPAVDTEHRDNWAWNPLPFDAAIDAAVTLLNAARPSILVDPRWNDIPPEEGPLGFQMANRWIALLRDYDPADHTGSLQGVIALLGPSLKQITEITPDQLREYLQQAINKVGQPVARRAAS